MSKGIGERINSVRKKAGLSQKAFAKRLSTSSGYISEVESGKIMPGSTFLINLNNEFDESIDWILTGKIEYHARDSDISDDPNLSDLLEGAKRVLTSGNPVAVDALERNIRYFAHAIEVERKLERMEERILRLEQGQAKRNATATVDRKAG